ncbi:hypothetical protein EOD41_11490 [Mucilaginibacter limnophilus]|uniref:Beta-xylosidase n=1 Tax=Mucilaginibacter limnophilus TaxID=1932778 RepID=A0A3S2V1C9_9SPHI|nr:hypothetical protein [Mucilaginibacter limnophilus]RVU00618.1 hypothetical protein EOD41_11490 [Mucilaginibacter limnophilus]
MNKFTYSVALALLFFGLTGCKKDITAPSSAVVAQRNLITLEADASNLIFEPFELNTGILNGQVGWTRIGGTAGQTQVVAGNLTYPNYLPGETGNKVELLPANTEDLNLDFGQRSGAGTRVYASMLINVTAASSAGDYFAHFFGNLFKDRVMIRAAGDGFNIGMDGGSGTATYLPDTYTFGQTYLVVISYQFVEGSGNDIASLWVNPDLSGAEPAPSLTNVAIGNDDSNLNGFRLRQNTAATSPTLTVDGIKVGLTWAGSVLATQKGTIPSQFVDSAGVDFGYNWRAINHVAAGFLHGFTNDGIYPVDSLILPLKLHMVRSIPPAALAQGTRMKQLGIKQQVVLSDNWYFGYESTFYPGDNGDWSIWETFVDNQIKDIINKGIQDNVEIDIWNEPDHSYFWRRSQWQALATYYKAYYRIRAKLPNAVIVGPSISSNTGGKIKEFLRWAKESGVVPDVISWHFPSNIVADVQDVRNYLRDNGMANVKININEYTLGNEQYAGKHAWLLAQLERAQVDGAIHAIWSDQATGTLDDILTPTFERKASWWVYKAYADVTGTTVGSKGGQNVELFAGKDAATKTIHMLLGAKPTLLPGDVKIIFRQLSHAFPGFTPPSGKFRVRLERIPENSGLAVNAPELVFENDMPLVDSFNVTIPWTSAQDAYVIHISASPEHP